MTSSKIEFFIVTDQERLWEETFADYPVTELDARQGELTPIIMNSQLDLNIPVLLLLASQISFLEMLQQI